MPPAGESPDAIPRGLIIAVVILFLAILAAGVLFYQSQQEQITIQVANDLTAISNLKADQIAVWREDRLFDARVVSSSSFFTEGADHYLTHGDNESREKILSRFEEMNASPHYDNVLLVDTRGNVRLSLDPLVTSLDPSLTAEVNASLQSGDAVLTDFHRMPGSPHIHLYAIAPLAQKTAGSKRAVGAVLLSIDPNDFLYPLVQSWPVHSESAETLLVEREDDHVLFLNDLRHQSDTALNLTIPLSQTQVPAVMAVLGTTGAFAGRDYRGVEVISALVPVPGSPWFMVTKVDAEEAYAPSHTRLVLIIVLVVGLLAGALIIIALVWQRRQKYYYRSLVSVEAERRRTDEQSRERLETLLRLSGMESAGEPELMDFVLGAGCRLTESSLAFFGVMSRDQTVFDIMAWSKSAMKDCSVAVSPIHFPIDKAGIWAEAVRKQKPVIVNDYPAPQAGKKGLPKGHVPITRFASVPIFDEERIVMVCAVANREKEYSQTDVDNLSLLMQGVWTHIRKRAADEALQRKNTDLEAAYEEIAANEEELKANLDELVHSQRALEESERKYRSLYPFAQVGLFETSFKDATIVACNQRYATLAGFSSIEDAIGKDIVHLYVNADDRTEVGRILREQGSVENHTLELRNQSTGKIFWAQFSARFNFDREVAEGSIIDITAQKDAEGKIRETNEYLNKLIDFANAPIVIWNPDYTIIRFNHAFEHITGRTEQEVLGKPLETLFPAAGRAAALASIKRTLEGERWESIRIPVISADGSEHTLLWNSANTLSEGGDLISTIAHGIDITDRERAEERLKESETRFRTMIDWTNDWEYWIGPGREVLYVSPSVERITGYSPSEFTTDRMLVNRIIPPDDLSLWEEHLVHHADAIHPVNQAQIEFRIIGKDGSLRWIGHVCRSIYTEDGTWLGTRISNRDITDRKQADADLATAQQQYRDLFENVSIGILRSTPGPEGSLIEVNPAAIRIFDADSREQLLAVPPSALYIDHDERRRISEEIVSKGAISGMEVRFRTLQGRAFWGRITASKKVSDNGQVYFDNTIEDITDRKRAEESLKESEEKFHAMFERHDSVMLLIEPETGNIIDANIAAERFYGRSQKELCALSIDKINTLSQEEIAAERMKEAREQKNFFTFMHRLASGEIRTVEVHSSPIVMAGKTVLFSIISDITDRKRAEEQLLLKNNAFESSIAANSIADKQGIITHVNPAFLKLWGYRTAEEAIGHSVNSFFAREEDGLPVIEALNTVGRWEGEFLAQRTDGSTFVTQGIATVIRDGNGEPIGYQSTNLDITERKRSEEELKASEEKFSTAFKTSPYAITITRIKDGSFLEVNDAFTPITGFTHEEARSGSSVGLGLWVDAEDRKRVIATLLDGRTVSGEEFLFRKKDGGIITGLFSARIISLNNEPCILSSINDISDRKRAEEEIKSANAFLDMIVDMSPFSMWISDKEGTVTKVNRSLCQTINLSRDEIVGKYNVLHDTNLQNQGVMPDVRAVYEKHTPARFSILWKAADAGSVEFEGARDMHIDVSLFPILNVRGELTNVVCQWVDITDRKHAEDALRNSNEYLRNLLDYTNAPIIVWDPQFRITRFNHAFERLTGRTEEEVLGRNLALLFPVLSRETSLARIQQTLAGERWEAFEMPVLHVSGEVRTVLWSSANLVDPAGAVISTIAQGQDITDRKLTEEQRERLIAELEQKNAELERFTYTVSHDLKSPLITIKGFAGLLEDDARKGDPVQLKKDIQRIMDAADTMQDLLVDLIELSRVGKIIKPPQKIPFGTIAHEAVNLLAGPLAERNVTVSIASDMPVVNVDQTRIREVMVNLLENAVRFLGDRPDPEIRIGVDTTGETPVFFVADNGIGINPRYLERIFNLFERLDASAPGTGIGLTIARRIIEVHGGKCWAESEGPGNGTTFRFTLPVVPADEGTEGP
jgi:PAS domain S-box-containing protein